jgi:hypothetical protein
MKKIIFLILISISLYGFGQKRSPNKFATQYDVYEYYLKVDSNVYKQTKSAGTVATISTSDAILNFGTTDPSIKLSGAGTYLINSNVLLDYVTTRLATRDTVVIKIKRANNTATNIDSIILFAPADTMNRIWGQFSIPDIIYTTSNSNDSLQINAYLKHATTHGYIRANKAQITAVRLYR